MLKGLFIITLFGWLTLPPASGLPMAVKPSSKNMGRYRFLKIARKGLFFGVSMNRNCSIDTLTPRALSLCGFIVEGLCGSMAMPTNSPAQ